MAKNIAASNNVTHNTLTADQDVNATGIAVLDAPVKKARKARRAPQGHQAPAEQRAKLLAGQDDGDGAKNVAVIVAQLKLLEDVAKHDINPNQLDAAAMTKLGITTAEPVEKVRNHITQTAKMVLIGFGLSNQTKHDDEVIGYGPYARTAVTLFMNSMIPLDDRKKNLPEAKITVKSATAALLDVNFQAKAGVALETYVGGLKDDVSADTKKARANNLKLALEWISGGLFKDLLTSIRWLSDLGSPVAYGGNTFGLDTAIRIALGRSLTASKARKSEIEAANARAEAAKNAQA